MTACGQDTQTEPSSAPTEMGGCLNTLVIQQTACVERSAFWECWKFIFQNVIVNATCRPLYVSTVQPAEGYQQVQSSKFKVQSPVAL